MNNINTHIMQIIIKIITSLALFSSTILLAQQEEKEIENIFNVDSTLAKETIYKVNGDILVHDGVTLTIEEGVIFKSEKIVNFKIASNAKVVIAGSYDLPVKAFRSGIPDKFVFQILSDENNKMVNYEYFKIENPTIIVRQ